MGERERKKKKGEKKKKKKHTQTSELSQQNPPKLPKNVDPSALSTKDSLKGSQNRTEQVLISGHKGDQKTPKLQTFSDCELAVTSLPRYIGHKGARVKGHFVSAARLLTRLLSVWPHEL